MKTLTHGEVEALKDLARRLDTDPATVDAVVSVSPADELVALATRAGELISDYAGVVEFWYAVKDSYLAHKPPIVNGRR